MSLITGQITQTRTGLGFAQARRIVLNNADILALPTTVPLLVPAEVNRGIVLLYVSFVFDPWVAAVTNIDGSFTMAADNPGGFYTNLGAINDTFDLGILLSGTTPGFDFGNLAIGAAGDYAGFLTDLFDSPIGLFTTNGVLGNFTGGDPANQLTVTTYYLTIP